MKITRRACLLAILILAPFFALANTSTMPIPGGSLGGSSPRLQRLGVGRWVKVLVRFHRDVEAERLRGAAWSVVEREAETLRGGFAGAVRNLEARGLVRDPKYFSLITDVSLKVRPSAIAELRRLPEVARVDVDHRRPWISDRSALKARAAGRQELPPYGLNMIRADEANAAGYRGEGAIVGILDTGIQPGHEGFATGQVLRARCRSFVEYEPTIEDGNGHGTHCAGTIGGQETGVAPGVKLISAKVLDSEGNGDDAQVISGVEYMAQIKPDVVSMSMGGPARDGDDPLARAVRNAITISNVIFVVAAGNSGPGSQTIATPALVDEAQTIGAIGRNGELQDFSSRGPTRDGRPKPDYSEPGADVVSLALGGGFVSFSGTSQATPHAAGVNALYVAKVLSEYRAAERAGDGNSAGSLRAKLNPARVKRAVEAATVGPSDPNAIGEGYSDCILLLTGKRSTPEKPDAADAARVGWVRRAVNWLSRN